jgi:hypothetical protein
MSHLIQSVNDLDEPQIFRYVVGGKVSHGKSSIVNAILRDNVLGSEGTSHFNSTGNTYRFNVGDACTAWPIIIRHDPTCEQPYLKITLAQFEPFLQTLRALTVTSKIKLSNDTSQAGRKTSQDHYLSRDSARSNQGISQEQYPTIYPPEILSRKFLGLSRRQQDHLIQFESSTYCLPTEARTNSEVNNLVWTLLQSSMYYSLVPCRI